MRIPFVAALALSLAIGAQGGTISLLSPSSFKVNSAEHFITIFGTDLGSRVAYSGPAGNFELDINARDASSITAWVPVPVINNAGTYSLTVLGGRTGDSGPVTFNVGSSKFDRLVLLIPESLVFQAFTREGTSLKYEVTAVGGEDPNPVVNCEPKSGSTFTLGRTIVNCAASNIYGERADAQFTVTMYDGAVPELKLPDRIVVDADSPEGTNVKYETSAYDAIDGDLAVTCDRPSGSLFPPGLTNVNCTAVDSWLNPARGTFPVEVGKARLTLRLPDAITAEAEGPDGASVRYEVGVWGTEDLEPSIKCDPPSESLFPLETTTVGCVAEDRFGQVAEGRFDVTVVDRTGPYIATLTADPELLDPNGDFVEVRILAEAYDLVDPRPQCVVTGVTANEPITPEDWRILSDLSVAVLAKNSGNGDRVYSVAVDCSDSLRNLSTGTANITVGKGSEPLSVPASPSTKKRRSAGGGR